MKRTKLKMIIVGILVGAFFLASVGSALAMALDYQQFYYGGKQIRWESKLALYDYRSGTIGTHFVRAQAESFSWYRPWSERYQPHGWRPWYIDKMRIWVKLTTPTGYQRSTYGYAYNKYYSRRDVPVRYIRGRYKGVSTHRYWEGSAYRYKALYDSWYFN